MGWGSNYRNRADWREAEVHMAPAPLCLAETILIFAELDRVLGTSTSLTQAAKRILEHEPGTERAAIAAEWLRIHDVTPANAVADDLRALAERCTRWKP